MKGLEPSAAGPPDRCSTKLSYIQISGRRRGIRTPIQAPKASVLPLHYVLYMVLGAGLGPAISKLSVWCLTNLATPTYISLTCIYIISNFFIKIKYTLRAASTITTSPPDPILMGPSPYPSSQSSTGTMERPTGIQYRIRTYINGFVGRYSIH